LPSKVSCLMNWFIADTASPNCPILVIEWDLSFPHSYSRLSRILSTFLQSFLTIDQKQGCAYIALMYRLIRDVDSYTPWVFCYFVVLLCLWQISAELVLFCTFLAQDEILVRCYNYWLASKTTTAHFCFINHAQSLRHAIFTCRVTQCEGISFSFELVVLRLPLGYCSTYS